MAYAVHLSIFILLSSVMYYMMLFIFNVFNCTLVSGFTMFCCHRFYDFQWNGGNKAAKNKY